MAFDSSRAATGAIFCLIGPLWAGVCAAEPIDRTIAAIETQFAREAEATRGGRVDPVWLSGGRFVFSANGSGDLDLFLADPARGDVQPLARDVDVRAALVRAGATADAPIHLDGASDDAGVVRVTVGEAIYSVDVRHGVARLDHDATRAAAFDRPRLISDQLPTTFGDLVEIPSPDGRRFITLVGDNLALRAAGSGEALPITNDGSRDQTWRSTEESAQSFSAAWSPDGRLIAAVRLDTRAVAHEPVMRWLTTPPTVDRLPYARAGEALPRFDLFVIDPDSGRRVAMQLGDTHDCYVNILNWRGDGRAVFVQVIDRAHKHLRVLSIDAATGAATTVVEERSASYFDTPMTAAPRLLWALGRSNGFLYLSERGGWRHIYRYDSNGARHRLTVGAWPVNEIVAVDEDRRLVFFLASADQRRPYDVQLWRIGFDGGAPVLLDGGAGNLTATMSPDLDWVITRRSSVETPPVVTLRASSDGRAVATLSRVDPAPLAALGVGAMEPFVTRSADGRWDMHGVILRPYNFDPGRRYPVVEVAYGGMQWDFIPRDYYGFGMTETGYNGLVARSLAARGYVVVFVSAPGTPGRGRAFQDATYGVWPQTVVANHAKWIREAAASRPWMDTSRLGIFGNSWGGYIAQRAMIEAPDLYDAAVAMSPPSDFVDHPAYIEPFMGLPSDNPEGYAAASNLARVAEITGPVLVMPEPLDVNAGFSPGMKFVDAMVEARRDVELFTFPDMNHRVNCCGRAREYYAYALVARFFDRTLSSP